MDAVVGAVEEVEPMTWLIQPPKPQCPTCREPVTSYEEHAAGAVCIGCEPDQPGKRHRRYEPCLHIIEVTDANS